MHNYVKLKGPYGIQALKPIIDVYNNDNEVVGLYYIKDGNYYVNYAYEGFNNLIEVKGKYYNNLYAVVHTHPLSRTPIFSKDDIDGMVSFVNILGDSDSIFSVMDFVVIAEIEKSKFMANEVSVLYRDNLDKLKEALPEYVEEVNKEFLSFNPSLINNDNRRKFPFAITSEYNLKIEKDNQFDKMIPPRIKDFNIKASFILSASSLIIKI
ncbi:MAG: hypothetical protein RXO36_02205 [Candidatus Nanopusillus acidilobi]